MMPRATITIAGVPAGEGRPVYLVGDEGEARRMSATGAIALSPELIEALGVVAQVFPGSSVKEIRKAGGKR